MNISNNSIQRLFHIQKVLLTIFVLSYMSLEMQGQITSVQGRVIDQETKQPVPFAHLSIIGTNIGTITNGEGFFVLNINYAKHTKGVKISYVGYKSKVFDPKDFSGQSNFTLALTPHTLELEEVTILEDRLSAEEIVLKAYANIPLNYEFEEFHLTGYYKESEHFDNGDPVYIAEAITQSSFPLKSAEEDLSVYLLKHRKSEMDKVKKMKTMVGGVYWRVTTAANDPIDPMLPKKSKRFIYEIEEYTEYNGIPVVSILYKKRKGRQYSGKFLIELENYAFIKIEEYIKHGSGLPTDNWKWVFRSYVDEFTQNEKGKWYVKTSLQVSEWIFKKSKQKFQTRIAYTTTNFSLKNIYAGQGQYFAKDDRLFAETSNYDPGFWEGYNFVSMDSSEKEAIRNFKTNSEQN